MQSPKVLVTGATGKTGAAVVAQLLLKKIPVRALVHSIDARSQGLQRLGAELAVADMFDYDQMLAAVRGTQRAYYFPPFHPHAIQASAIFAGAAQEAKLEAIVGMSQWLASPSHPSLATRHNWLTDRMFSTLPGIAHVIVNPGYFADNYLRLIDFASLLGIFPVLTSQSRNAPPSNEDIARVAVAALIDPSRHAGKSYRPTGPKLLSAFEMASIIQEILGTRVRAMEMPWWMFLRAARLQGVDPFLISSLRYYVEDHKSGAFEFCAPNNVVQELTGSPAEDFETTVRRYASLPFAQRTLSNRSRALIDFLRMPFSAGYNLTRYERGLNQPAPPEPLYAMQNGSWKFSHSETSSSFDFIENAVSA